MTRRWRALTRSDGFCGHQEKSRADVKDGALRSLPERKDKERPATERNYSVATAHFHQRRPHLITIVSLLIGMAITVIAEGAAYGGSGGHSSPVVMDASDSRGSVGFRIIGGSKGVLPISIEAGEVVVEVSINGRGPFRRMFDTGSQNAVTRETAAALD